METKHDITVTLGLQDSRLYCSLSSELFVKLRSVYKKLWDYYKCWIP